MGLGTWVLIGLPYGVMLMGFAWVVYRVNPTQEYRTLYLSVRHSYERNKTL